MNNNAILIAVNCNTEQDFDYKIEEMERLIEADNLVVTVSSIQSLKSPNPATYMGVGKLHEIKELIAMLDIQVCVVADSLTPSQLKNITDILECRIIDRTGLILEIFSDRARTREARLQVEIAKLQYMLPRLVGLRKALGRQGGTSGSQSNRGQGEKQIELDKRHIEKRISELNKELEEIENVRLVQRKLREKGNIPSVALVGYTNAGKSTLMNALLQLNGSSDDKKVYEKDMLFATLDTTIRHITVGDKKDFLLSDTVGFVSDLPHGLIKAFRSTLSEARCSDLLLIVLDSSDKNVIEQRKVTELTLSEIGCENIPRLYVYNKIDKSNIIPLNNSLSDDIIHISSREGTGIKELITAIQKIIYSENEILDITVPYSKGSLIDIINRYSNVKMMEYQENGIHIISDCPKWLIGKVNSEIH